MSEKQSDNFLRFGTIFYKSKLKLINFVMMVYCFTKWNRKNAQTSNKESLPQNNYKDKDYKYSEPVLLF